MITMIVARAAAAHRPLCPFRDPSLAAHSAASGAETPPQVGAGSSAVRRMARAFGPDLRSAGEKARRLGAQAAAANAGPRAGAGARRLLRRLADPGDQSAEPAGRGVRAGRAPGVAADLAAALAGARAVPR